MMKKFAFAFLLFAVAEIAFAKSIVCTRLTGNATTTLKSGNGMLYYVVVGDNTTGGTVTAYDNTAASGTVILKLSIGAPSLTSGQEGPAYIGPLDHEFNTGLTIVTAGSANNDICVGAY